MEMSFLSIAPPPPAKRNNNNDNYLYLPPPLSKYHCTYASIYQSPLTLCFLLVSASKTRSADISQKGAQPKAAAGTVLLAPVYCTLYKKPEGSPC